MDLFGKSGAELVPTLVAIGTNSKEINAQLSAIGGPVSAEAIAKVDTLGDQLDVLQTAGKSTAIELAALAAVVLGPLLEATNSWISSLRILVGGGGELERLERRLEILRESQNSIPFFLNLGYIENGKMIMGPRALQQAIGEVGREIDRLKMGANLDSGIIDIAFDIPEPEIPDLGGGKKKGKAALTPAQIREKEQTEREKNYKREYDLKALHLTNLELLSTNHAATVATIDATATAERIRLATDFQYLQSGIQSAFGLQQLDFEAIKNSSIIDLAGEMFSALGGAGTKFFKIQQGFAIANAIINTAQGITEALKLPFPLSLAAAAKVAVAGAIQIAKIKSTNVGGSGSVSKGGLSGGATSATSRAAPDGNSQQAQEPQQRIAQVVIQGSVFSNRETADWLIGQLSEAINDRDVVFINGNSRQAGLIGGT
jgi:hypothetical protein